MKKLFSCALLLMLLALTAGAQTTAQWPDGGQEAKAGSRWWWLGSAVDEANLRWNMEQYAQAGLGTLEITPIYGVKGNASRNITFLSEAWLDKLKFVEQTGRELGIAIDMTTGTGWPFGGPMVRLDESASRLVTETLDVTGDGSTETKMTLNTANGTLQRVMAFPQKGNDGEVVDLTSLVNGKSVTWTAPEGKWQLIAAYCQRGVMQVKRPSPGSEGYVLDYFDSTAVAHYLDYFDKRFGDADDAPWPHAFFNDSYEINQADWTPGLFEQFERRRGYKLENCLDKLLNRDAQVYADYRQTLADLLRDHFTRQWTEWAHRHGSLTRNQAHGSPGNLIDLYAEADIPEIESFYLTDFGIRGLRNDAGYTKQALSTRATLKYASSAAHITGKKLTSSESLTWLTEHFRTSLSQMKPELDLLFTSGVNRVLFHGTCYSPRDAVWPGWKFYASVDMSPTNSIWRDAPSMLQYIERVQSFLQMGEPDNDVLVYAPFANAMRKTTGSFQNRLLLFDINTLSSKMSELEQCVNNLERAGLDCDYTSERYLLTTTCADGQLQTAAGQRYKALVVPVSDNLPDSVKTHLETLAAQGATIVYGRDAATLSALQLPAEPMRSEQGLSVIRRRNATGYHYFIANLTPDDVAAYVPLAVSFRHAVLFDPCQGTMADAAMRDGRVWIALKSGQSVLLQTYDDAAVTAGIAAQPLQELTSIAIDGRWQLSFADDCVPSMQGRTYQLDGLQSWETLDEQTAQLMGTGIYETNFTMTPQQMKTATGGFRLSLGDVRESARVWLNGEYIGCAWSVPFELDCQGLVREGSNSLRIEVTNLPANRIRQMDREGKEWRIFEDINMSNISTASYADWQLMPSGLNSRVSLVPLATEATGTQLTLQGLAPQTDGYYLAQYQLALPGATVASVSMTDAAEQPFEGFSWQAAADGTALLTLTGASADEVVVTATDTEGTVHYAYLHADGPYRRVVSADFTSTEAPAGDWMKLASQGVIRGFSATGKQDWYRAKLNGRDVTLYDGLSFTSERSTYYFFFPGYGMYANNPFTATVREPAQGMLCQLSYLQGDGNTEYVAADSLNRFVRCADVAEGLSLPLEGGSSSYVIYRSLQVFSPVADLSGMTPLLAPSAVEPQACYNLQGQRVSQPRRGIYVRGGRKIVVR